MSNLVGLSLIAAFLALEACLIVGIGIRSKKRQSKAYPLKIAAVLLPAFLLWALNPWTWSDDIQALVDLPYSWFHFIFLALTILACVWSASLGFFHREKASFDQPYRQTDRTVLLFGLFFLGIELYKQIFYANLFTGYAWYLFPFQFCSVPIYVCLIAPWMKNVKRKESCYDFAAIYGFIAGIAVMALPNTVFVQTVSICIHTMIWHGGMVALGIYLLFNRRIGSNLRQWARASSVLALFIAAAIFINFAIIVFDPDNGLNAFFLNPFHPSPFPVLSRILADGQARYGILGGWLLYLLSYLGAFFLGGLAVFGGATLFQTPRAKPIARKVA